MSSSPLPPRVVPGPAPRPAVTVIGSGRRDHPETGPLGRALAERGFDLVTGGGGGTMAGVSRAFFETPGRGGRVVGILPADPDRPGEPPEGYPNPWVELAIRTHLPGRGRGGGGPDSRNHLVVLTGRLIVALPGGPGTETELALAVRYRRPVLLLGWPEDAPPAPLPGETAPAGTAPEVYRFARTAPLIRTLERLLAEGSTQPPPDGGRAPRPPHPPRERRM